MHEPCVVEPREHVLHGPAGLSAGPGSVVRRERGERVQELADRVVVLRDTYYRGSPLVADAEYDAIEHELRALIAANPELAPDPNPLKQVGAGGAARAGPALASDAVVGEGDQARAGCGVLRPILRPAGGGHAEAGRAVAGGGLRGRAAGPGGHPRGRHDRGQRDRPGAGAGQRGAGADPGAGPGGGAGARR